MKFLTWILFEAALSEEVCLKYWNDVNLSGYSIEQPKKVSNLEECGQACFSNNDCQAFSYSDDSSSCRLIKDVTSWSAVTGFTSGVRCYAEADNQPETSPSGFMFSKCANGICVDPADIHCPTSSCWTYELNLKTGKNECKLKTDKIEECAMYLDCKPKIMDFRFNKDFLLGENTVLLNNEATCPILESTGLVGSKAPTGANRMWKHAPASCDSEVSRETKNNKDWIVVKKSFKYRGDNEPKNIGDAAIYLDDAASVTIEICCRFLASHKATSDEITVEEGNVVEGKLEAEGSWTDSLAIEYTDPTFLTKLDDDHVTVLGSTFYVKVTWSVGDAVIYPMAEKLNWFVSDCSVSDADNTEKSVMIIEKQCFAQVVNTKKLSAKMQSDQIFKFSYSSFSFKESGAGKQKISCDIKFCMKADECSTKTDLVDQTCDASSSYKWAKP